MNYTLVLHNIRSAHNVGSIFRTADAAGVAQILLSGYAPAPVDRFGRERRDLAKVALGAEKTVPWERHAQLSTAIKKLKRDGWRIVALEQAPGATALFSYKPQAEKIALVAGNEVRGISPRSLKLCDDVVEIPMRGTKESLNVSVAAGVALFYIAGLGGR